jgi:hypothetical protein
LQLLSVFSALVDYFAVAPFAGFLFGDFLSLTVSFVGSNLIRHAGSIGRTGLTVGSVDFFAMDFILQG